MRVAVAALLGVGLVLVIGAPAPGPSLAPATVWTPPEIASGEYESSPAFSPDGRHLVFFRADRAFQRYRLLESRCVAGGWNSPAPPSFAAKAGVLEADPHFTPDGRRLYFVSSRPDPDRDSRRDDLDIWVVERGDDQTWSRPVRLPAPVNSPGSELLPRLAADGRLIFGSDRPGGFGGPDIYQATLGPSGAWSVENLGAPVNTGAGEYEAEISRDLGTLIVVADRGDRSHLYRFEWRDFEPGGGRWVEQDRLPARPDVFQVGPVLSPDGGRLLFSQELPGRSGEIHQLDLAPGTDPSWPPACPPRDSAPASPQSAL